MDLFDDRPDEPIELLNKDGSARYYGALLPAQEADNYFQRLFNGIDWQYDEAVIFGRHITTRRKVAWYGERPFRYTYSKTTKLALPWTAPLLELKAKIEAKTGETFNACLLNLYHDGSEGMAWHSDGEADLKKHGAIASLSLGAERKFSFKHKRSNERVAVFLKTGSLLVMKGETQSHWLHQLPVSKKVTTPRVNLTFRTIVGQFDESCTGRN